MKSLLLLFFNCTCLLHLAVGQQTINGYISDAQTGERLIGANVFHPATQAGSTTNEQGFYSLTISTDKEDVIWVSYVGYQTDTVTLTSANLNIPLEPVATLNAVEITSNRRTQEHQVTQMSRIDLPIDDIKSMPVILGEVDIIKSLQLLPGVQAGNEGLAGMYVRGGSPDQNLVMLDGVPIYNPTHAIGIFSVFNADAVKNVSLIKGGFPARYGGRLSSVLNVNMKEGNLKEWHGEGAVSIAASKLTVEGPIQKDKTSLLVSARRTYIDLLLNPIVKAASDDINQLGTYFYDLNGKLQHIINDQHSLHASAYAGRDVLRINYEFDGGEDGGELAWQNRLAALRWNYRINAKTFLNTTLYATNYEVDISQFYKTDSVENRNSYLSSIQDYALRSVLDWIPTPEHYVRLGGSWIRHTYKPSVIAFEAIDSRFSRDTLLNSNNVRANEYNVFIEDDWSINDRWSANVGLHAAGFEIEDFSYFSLQPRLSLRYQWTTASAVKASFARMSQFVHLLSSEAIGLPSDLWVPATEDLVPQEAWQAAFGVTGAFRAQYTWSVEGFYKQIKNVVSYREGAAFVPDVYEEAEWTDQVVQGDGEVYGMEVLFKKEVGKTTGWLGYTWSWNWRQFDDINVGERYPFRFDRRHDLALVLNHQQNERISYSLAWIYGTGNAVTIPTARYATSPNAGNNFPRFVGSPLYPPQQTVTGGKNNYRMSATHRLDASVSFYKRKKRYDRWWIFGVYNAYSHVNPYFITESESVRVDENGNVSYVPALKEIGLLPIIPSITYRFKF